ncbi:MAG: nuclear transport factor 2 family protein [Candidatus Hodarchaeales archaeon]|jgi:ketosteroid isomerase-like protein
MNNAKNEKDLATFHNLAENILDAWNSQDVDRVLTCYSEDLKYLDPNTQGEIKGKDAFRHYLTRLFSQWKMTWSLRELFPLQNQEGVAFLWRAILQKKGSEREVTVDGMDLAILQGEHLIRNEVYFDRSILTQQSEK